VTPLLDRVKARLRPLVHGWRAHARARALARSAPHLDQAALRAQLAALPIPQGTIVLVHSALKSLGYVEGGANAVVAALIETIVIRRGGTLMLPCYSIEGGMVATLAAGRPFDARTTPSNLGAIPEAFRRHPGVLRSCHPTHSFAAIGPAAAWLLDGAATATTSFGADTPLARLREAPSQLLGLGSDIGHVTYYHCLEDLEDFPIDVYAPELFTLACTDRLGEVHRMTLRGHAPGVLQARRIDHPSQTALRALFQAALEREAGLSWHRVGTAACWLVDGPAMYRTIADLLAQGQTIYGNVHSSPRSSP